jgi:hypothetical protein
MASNATDVHGPLKTAFDATPCVSKKQLPSDRVQPGQPNLDRRILKFSCPHPGQVREKIISNLFPILEYPRDIYLAEARFQTEFEVSAACRVHGPLPFLLRYGRVYAFAPLTVDSVLAPALKMDVVPSKHRVADWLAKPECAQLVIDLFDRMLRYHAWKRGLRFDEMHKLFYFTRSKPKSVYWEIDGRRIQQEVTAPLMNWNQTEPEFRSWTAVS